MVSDIFQFILHNIIPIIFGFLAVVGSVPMLFAKKAVNIVAGLLLTMVSLACLYFYLNAMFVGIIQIIVYTGAILMTFIFIIANTSIASSDSFVDTLKQNKIIAYIFSGIFFLILVVVILMSKLPKTTGLDSSNGTATGIGANLFSQFALTVVGAGALLCVTAFGVIYSLKIVSFFELSNSSFISEKEKEEQTKKIAEKPIPTQEKKVTTKSKTSQTKTAGGKK